MCFDHVGSVHVVCPSMYVQMHHGGKALLYEVGAICQRLIQGGEKGWLATPFTHSFVHNTIEDGLPLLASHPHAPA